jgi:hypothetical protein
MIGMIPELNGLSSIRLANTGKAVQPRGRDVIDGCDGIASSQQPVASSQSPAASRQSPAAVSNFNEICFNN